MPRPRRKSHLAHRRSAAAESTRRHCRFCGESACTVAVAVAASSSGAAAGEEGVQTTPTLGVFPTKCCRPPPRPISHFLSASVFLKRQKQGPGRGEAGPRSRTGSRPAWVSLIPERTGSTTTSLPRWWTQPHSHRGRGSARRRSPSTPRSSTSATSLAGPRECPTHSPSTWWSLSMPTSWLPLLTPTRCNPEWRANAHPMPARASQGRKLQKKSRATMWKKKHHRWRLGRHPSCADAAAQRPAPHRPPTTSRSNVSAS